MSASKRLKVVLCWHMHQPEYRDLARREFQLPWTYLHAIKDYVDMAAHIESVPEARCVVNFAPVLLDQIADYAGRVRTYLDTGAPVRDPLLGALGETAFPSDAEHRLALIRACLRANEQRLIKRFKPYAKLVEIARWVLGHGDAVPYMDDQFLADLLVWYHLAWLGETVRRSDRRAKTLMDKARMFTLRDRRVLLEVIAELLEGLCGRWRALAERGQVELSMTPYAHPIVPLLLDLASAREAIPDAPLPLASRYPDGEERARWHVQRGIESFRRHFGLTPTGCWPSEGSVSTATLALLEDCGLRWAASGESVLRNSLAAGGIADPGDALFKPYRIAGGALRCFFRADGLSDLIGFSFSEWHADDAVAHLTHQLENIAKSLKQPDQHVVSIILDGENAWEFYPENGYYFLSALYKRLAEHPGLELTTFSECLGAGVPAGGLDRVTAGSWVYGTFSTWIGSEDKNRGWDMLCEARQAFSQAVRRGGLGGERLELATVQLAACEGSDWFWWFGDYNPAESVRDFDRLYRTHLGNLYRLIGEECPEYLSHPFTHGGGSPETGGVMRRGSD